MPDNDYSGLAGALAKAQAAFPKIQRDKEVTVQKKAGGSYKFKYAPLDTILEAVRKPLADNGLSIIQLLDEDYLVTSLLHESGAMLSGRTPIPQSEGIQAYGSAITYLRRYSIQALLGIAAEEDDDGNRADGNDATFGASKSAPTLEQKSEGGLIGFARKEAAAKTNFELRQTPEGGFIGFRLKEGKDDTGYICEIRGPMAEAVKLLQAEFIGKRVQLWGTWVDYTPPTVQWAYRAFRVEKISTPAWVLPAPGVGGSGVQEVASGESSGTDPSAPSIPLFSEEEDAALDAAIGA